MWKKSSHVRRENVLSIRKKKKFGGKKTGEGDSIDEPTVNLKFLGLSRSKYLAFSRKCFQIIATACEFFYLIGIKRSDDGEFVPLSRKAQIFHYGTMVCLMAMLLLKTWLTLEDLIYNELRVQSFVGLCVFTVLFLTLPIGAGVLMRSKETMDVLNSWSHMGSCLEPIDPDFEMQPLNHLVTCLKVISCSFAGQAISVAFSSVGFIWSDLPQCLVPMVERFGLLPKATPRYVWQILFAPLEYLSLVLPIFLISFAVSVLIMGNGALDIYLQKLRQFPVGSLQSRLIIERMYVELELFNRIFQVWFRFFFPGMLFGASCPVILALFIFFRYTTALPFLMWLYFGYSGPAIALVLFWQCYDQILVVRISEDILAGLWNHDVPYFKRIKRQERLKLMKRAKAMRPVIFVLGDSEFTLSVPIATWDEIINQILFLMSL